MRRLASPLKLGLPLLLTAVLLLLAAPDAAAARRLNMQGRQLLAEFDTCTGCLSAVPSKPLPLASDTLSAAAADLAWLADPITLGITCQVMCTPEQQKQWLEKAKAVAAKMGAKTTQLVYIKESQAAALIFDIADKIFVAFGGPQIFYAPDLLLTTKVDPMATLNLGAHILPPTQRTVKVQEGLLYTAKGVYPELTKALAAIDKTGKKPIYFTGHSLGGALATLSAAMLHSWTAPAATNNTVAAVYTFGSPRAGGAAWAASYRTLGLDKMTLRYVYNRDVVPMVPQDAAPGKAYDHVGRLVYVTNCGCITKCANDTCGAYDYCAGNDIPKQKETCTAAAVAMKKVCALDGVPVSLHLSLQTTTMKLLCATASTLMPNFTLPLYDPSACCMFRTLAGMYLDPAAKGDPIDYMQGFSNYYPGWASQCLPDAPKCEGTAKCPPGVPCNNGAPCTPGSPCSGIDETPNLRPPTVHWDRPKPCATCPKPTCKPCEHPDPPPSTARKPSPPPPKRKPSPLPNCAATCMAKDGWNPVCARGLGSQNKGKVYPNKCFLEAKCTSDVSPNTPHYSYVVAGNYLCTHPPTCFERKEALARCKQAWGAAGGGESNADCGCNLIEELLSKKLDSQCAATCMAKDGWNPVCTANGLEAQGTLYPNKCFLEAKCTNDISPNSPHYSYLPFDSLICNSAVGCSLLGQAAARCKKAWVTAGGGESNIDCGCALIPSKLSNRPDPECVKDCMAKDGWNPVCADIGIASHGVLLPNKCFLEAKCTGNIDASTPSEPYLPFGDLCRSGRHCQFLGEKLARCQKEWGLPQDIVLGTEDCTCGYNPEKELFAAGAGGLGGSSSLKGPTPGPAAAPSPLTEFAAPGPSPGILSPAPGPSPGVLYPAPGPSPSVLSPAPGPSPSVLPPAPGPSPSVLSPAPGPSPSVLSPAPGPSPGVLSPAPGPSPSVLSPAPGPSPSVLSPAPGPSPSVLSPAPGPSPSVLSPAPSPSPGVLSPAPSPSPGVLSPALSPSPESPSPVSPSLDSPSPDNPSPDSPALDSPSPDSPSLDYPEPDDPSTTETEDDGSGSDTTPIDNATTTETEDDGSGRDTAPADNPTTTETEDDGSGGDTAPADNPTTTETGVADSGADTDPADDAAPEYS